MTAINWKNAASGDWSVAANWSTGAVPGLGDDVAISAVGPYIVRITSADLAHTVTVNASQAALLENAGSLTMAGVLTVDSGLVSLNEANTLGGVALAGGVLAFGAGAALGAGSVTLLAGELLGTASETLANGLSISATSTIAAAHGTTLTETGFTNISANSTLNFGALGQDGVVVWNPAGFAIGASITVNVAAGTLKAGSDFLADTISNGAKPTTVAAGATLDLGGFGLSLTDLLGGGAVIDSGAAATLTLAAANFSGAISGPLSLVSSGAVVLSGANTYTGATTINSGGKVQLGVGGATGSIAAGAIIDNGTLLIERNNGVTLTNAISGPGNLEQFGTGVTTINAANTYSGGTAISAGTLAIGNGGALGTGTVSLSGGELLTIANETLTNGLSFSGSSAIAAAHGTTLNETGFTSIGADSTLNFGAPGQDGVVVWNPAGFAIGASITVNVAAGTLKAGSDFLADTISNGAKPTTVAAGATLDLGGFGLSLTDLLGGGAVIDSGAPATLTLGAADFSGSISGDLSLVFNGATALSGVENYTGGATLGASATVANTGTYDIVGNTNISGNPVSSFINNGLFEKTGGGGVSDVTSNFINGGTLNVLSGSIEFSGGFTNNGVIHGRVTQSGGVTKVSALVPSDFNEDGMSDILWQNADGQAAIWEINGTSQIPGGNSPIDPNPGPSWKVIGSGDFNGDGQADVLWQNANGQAAAVEMDGAAVIGGGAVNPNPGPAWKAVGTGDFNDDGHSDILWQNASTGQASIWEMNGNSLVGGGAVSPNPGPSWKAIGTGDFNGDGHSDILWQNTNTGQATIWEMNGNSLIGGGPVSPNPGPNWRAIGTGDFNGDGFSDILFQNTSTGQATIWEMNGNTLIGGGPAGPDPGPTWHAIGTGDFNGDGFSDILWQNDSGQASIWEMNGTTQIPGGSHPVGPNPGPNWRAVA